MNTLPELPILLERLARIVHNEAHSGGLKPTQWEVLRYLAAANRFSRNPSAVTQYLGMTKGTVSQTITALERKGLVLKKSSNSDRRNVRLELSKSGLRLLHDDPLKVIQNSCNNLNKASHEKLAQQLNQLLLAMLASREGRPFGVCQSCRYFERNSPEGAPHRCSLLNVTLTDEDSGKICVEQEAAA